MAASKRLLALRSALPRGVARRGVASAAGSSTRVVPETRTTPLPGESDLKPKMITASPGPASQLLNNSMKEHQECSAVQFFVNYSKCYGNFLVDADDNQYLDVYGQIGSLPLGYNHPAMISMLQDPQNAWVSANRPALGVLPPTEWGKSLGDVLARIAPNGMTGCDITTMSCGSTANENAFKAAFIHYMDRKRGGKAATQEDLNSCMINAAPGCPSLSILSFAGGFHGRTFGCLATTRSKPIHKLDVPHFDWPMALFPQLKYPLEEFVAENASEEQMCLDYAEKLLVEHGPNSACPIAGMIIEPVQAEGGDNHASDDFFRRLRGLASKYEVSFICDEVQVGGGVTGKFWAHENWGLESPPDIVTFAKKTQIAGYFSAKAMRPKEGYRIFNTWMGDPAKMLMLETVIEQYEADGLLGNARVTGDFLLEGLKGLQDRYPHLIGRARGRGTLCAWSVVNTATRDKLVYNLRQRGVQSGACGGYSIRMRPAMVFLPQHAEIFLQTLDDTLSVQEVVGDAREEWATHAALATADLKFASAQAATRM